jgi:predicted membrane protein
MYLMKNKKQLIVIFALTGLAAWILGVLRFDHLWAKTLFNVLLFPFGLIYSKYEEYCSVNLSPPNFFNNEFLQLFLFGVSVIGQTFIYLFIYNQIRKHS